MSIYDHRDRPAYEMPEPDPRDAHNPLILRWWTQEHDDLLRQLISERRWVWYWSASDAIGAITAASTLDQWRGSDPVCSVRAWYNVLMNFALSRAQQLGLDKEVRRGTERRCLLCEEPFLEESLPVPLIDRLGMDRLEFCAPCLRDTVLQGGASPSLSAASISEFLRQFAAAMGRAPTQAHGEGRVDLREFETEKRLAVLRVLRGRPTVDRVKELFGSWRAALVAAQVLEECGRLPRKAVSEPAEAVDAVERLERPRSKRRASITKLQRETAAGAELIALCQTVTGDGRLVDDEIASLRQWLQDYRGSEFPAVALLRKTVERILADGRVTSQEREDLYRAIETVLPPDIRDSVRGTRLSRQRGVKVARLTREPAREPLSEAETRNTPVDVWDFMVAGVRYEGRPSVISEFAREGDVAFLIRDRANSFSRSAVEVRLSNGMQAGYVPEEHAVDVAPLLDAGHKHIAWVKKILTGGRTPIPVIVASLFSPDADRPDAILEHQVPGKPSVSVSTSKAAPQKTGCLLAIAVLSGLASGVSWAIVR